MINRASRSPLRIFIAHPSALLTDHLSNGDGLVAFSLVRRLAERGHDIHVAAQHVNLRHAVPPTLHIHGLTPRGDGSSTIDRLMFMLRMRLLFERLRRQREFDIVHQMNPVFTGLSLSLIGIDTPLVLGAYVPKWELDADHMTIGERRRALWDRVSAQVARIQQAQAAGILIASPQAMSRISMPDRHRDRIYEVPHGIDLSQFVERAMVPERPSILFLAAVARKKGVVTLLEAFRQVVATVPECVLTVAGGDGGALQEVSAMAAALPGGSVSIAGRIERSEVHNLMRAHSVFCVPSYGEPFGMSNLEAMACGVPIVGTRAGGIPDLVTEAGGRLVPPRDAASLGAALIEILRNRELQRSMGRFNRRRVEDVFDVERTADRLESAYRAVMSAPPDGARLPEMPAAQPRPFAKEREMAGIGSESPS